MPGKQRPYSLGRQFTFAAATLAAVALVFTTAVSWVLTERQERQSLEKLAAAEREFHASSVATDLAAIIDRVSDMASSTLLATGLVDSAGRETYLLPYLEGFRRVNGVPIHVLFTDFEGKAIASNGEAKFSQAELAWLQQALVAGRPSVRVMPDDDRSYLVGMQPLVYARTASPEGALFYKVAFDEMRVAPGISLRWGDVAASGEGGDVSRISVPPVLQPLQLRLQGTATTRTVARSTPAYLALLGFGLVAFAGVVVVGRRIAALLTRDLRGLEEFSRRVAERGSVMERAPEEGSAEVASVAASFNRMLDRLQRQHAELMGEQEKLQELAQALREADRRKDDFIATLSHELRNPLAPVRNGLQLLKMAPPEGHPQVIGMMERQVNLLVRLVDDLLEMSRITRDKIELRREPVDLRSAVANALDMSRPLIEANGHELRLRMPDVPLPVDGDRVRLAQIVANLVNNAAAYTPRGGTITVSLAAEAGTGRVAIEDTGIGLEAEEIPRMFEMFSRGESAARQGQGGLGIGLALALRLARMHSGGIDAASPGRGQGSTFTFWMPLAAGAWKEPAGGGEEGGGTLAGREVLVVDDNEDAADSLSLLLRHLGAVVRTAHSGSHALEMLRQQPSEVVLLDIGMPGLDGYETARRICDATGKHRPYLVALTGWGQPQDRERARAAGFDRHLVKPVEPKVLQETIASVERRGPS